MRSFDTMPSRWRKRTILAAAMLWTSIAAPVERAAAETVFPIEIRPPVSLAGAERMFWIGHGAGDDDATALRDALVAAGARNVNLFVPDMVVVCDVPPAARSAVARAATLAPLFRAHEGSYLRATTVAGARWGWIVAAYEAADRIEAGTVGVSSDGAAGVPFDDVVLTLSPQRVDEIQREVEALRRRDVTGTRPAVTRRSNQNSEFLGGYILANFIFPESDGSREASSENWSDDDLREARAGATIGLLNWQRFGQMDISYVFSFYDRVPTSYEPITHDMNTDDVWIVDTMRSLGWGLHSDNPPPIVHDFNENERLKWRTQWVVTSFIASSRNTPGHRFKNGGANYTAYAFLGGPYMVEPFPAGEDPNQIGEQLVYSQIVQHEVGHLFWTLDEYPGAPGVCASRSGYLDESNGNITMTGPGGEQSRCIPLVPCIMHTAARFNLGRPWCEYSKGHFGVADKNGNGYPDIFEAEPEITFVPEGPETVTTNAYTLTLRIRSPAVPNRNPYQAPDQRVSYALPLDGATLNLGTLQIGLDAADGRWDEVEEDCEFTVQLAQVGPVVFSVQARNRVGFRSQPVVKTVYFAGVRYDRMVALPKWNRIEFSWETTGETFGARFDVYRLAAGQSMPGTLVAQGVTPFGTGVDGSPAYRVHDFDVTAAEEYRYYVEGVFELPFEGGTREYRSRSAVVGQTAMLPLTDVVSNVSPNPTRGTVTFSVAVPRTLRETPRGPERLPTDVDIRVYDVRGRLIRALKTSRELNTVLTLRWDGTKQDGSPAPSGVYFLRVRAGDTEGLRKIVLLR